MCSIFSKDRVFSTLLKEDRMALDLSNDGYNALNVLLGQTHTNLRSNWLCEQATLVRAKHNYLTLCCLAIK